MHWVVLCVGVTILAVIAYGDIRTRRIPNALCVVIAVLGLIRIASASDALAAGYTVLAAAVIFSATLLLFWRGAIGGGDAKLITAMALLVGHQDVIGFLFLMSLFGGVLALAALARNKMPSRLACLRCIANRRSFIEATASVLDEPTVPYGLAIAAAGAIILITTR